MPETRYYRDSSERLTFEMFRIPAEDYAVLCKAVVAAFSLTPDWTSFGAGLDQVFLDVRRGEHVVELAWDIWSGFTVVAKTTDSESLVREIADWSLDFIQRSRNQQVVHDEDAADPLR